MKTKFLIAATSIFLAYSFQSEAQLSKSEKKELKNEVKAYKRNLESFKAFKEQHREYQTQVSSLKSQVKKLESSLTDKDAKISELQDQNENFKAELAAAKRKISQLQSAPKPKVDDSNYDEGVVFKVQVGAFKQRDMGEEASNQENFNMDEDGEVKKYTLGIFRDYWEADAFKKDLRQMGVQKAWIVSYKDGTRVPIKDVLEGII